MTSGISSSGSFARMTRESDKGTAESLKRISPENAPPSATRPVMRIERGLIRKSGAAAAVADASE